MESSCPHLISANLTNNLQGKLIYKDECTRCFDDVKTENGVDVCLKCFNGGCAGPERNHSMQHFNFANHPLTMNIKKILKVDVQEKKPQQITKLAIGKPGGIDAEQDDYDTAVTVKCLACNKAFDHRSPLLSGLVDSILLSQSAYFQQTISEWELKLEQCEHTLTLDQSGAQKIANKSLAHCGECDLSANLWLCMTCGHLGCGRKNWDGTGGNGHGKEHFDSTMHPLVCKLGTITPEGSASIYCYACNDDKLDENLSQHLAALGIDIATQKKTEKTIQEMDLEANLNLTLSKVIEEGKELTPLYGPGCTGMENLGNSCYMNSVLQVLFSMPEFQNRYQEEGPMHLLTCQKAAAECLMCQVAKLVDGILSGRYSDQKVAKKVLFEGQTEEEKSKIEYCQDGIKPHMFKTLVGRDHPEFKTSMQCDTQEYFAYLLEKLQRMEKSQGESTYPGDVFALELETRVQCQSCGGVKYNLTKGQQITLQAPVSSKAEKGTPVEFEACLQRFFGDEFIDDFFCGTCQKKTTCSKRQRINEFPKMLMVTLTRQVYDDWVPKKLEIELQLPTEAPIDFERFKGHNGQLLPGEIPLAQAAEALEEQEPELNGELLNQIIGMGVPELAAKHALYETGNNNADIAITWYFENMDNPRLNQPLPKVKKAKAGGASAEPEIPQELVDNLVAMLGFPEKKVKKALKNTDNNPERAADWLFSHMDDPESDHEMTHVEAVESVNPYKDEKPGIYELYGFITHLGSSVKAGHYVCHLRQAGSSNEWVYFNDAKVALTKDPPIGKGYMYVFRKK